jgi:hypothetical protein
VEAVTARISGAGFPQASSLNRWVWAVLALVLILAAALRLWRLDSVPPGLTHDEAGHGHDAVAILQGARPIYQTVGYGREPLYDYLAAGVMALGLAPVTALRLSSALPGVVALLFTFIWLRRAFDGPTALAAVAWQAASFWSLSTARQALRSSLLPVLFTAAIALFWQAVAAAEADSTDASRRRGALWALLPFALLVGATLYTYMAARVLWLLFPVYLVYLFLFHREVFRRVWLPALAGVLAGLLLSAPLFAYLWSHPGAEQRLGMLDAPLRALAQGDLTVILGRARDCVLAFFVPGRGDDFLAYNIPGRPLLGPLSGALFVLGIGLCVLRWRRPPYAFALLWFLVGVLPSLILGATGISTRGIAVLPVVFLFPALTVVEAARWAAARWGKWARWVAAAVPGVLIVITGFTSARDYFGVWGESPDVRAAYQHTLVETAAYLDAGPEGGTVALSDVYPHAPHAPYIFALSLRRSDVSLRWFDARRALVLPPVSTARLVAPSSAPLDPYFAALPGLRVRERLDLRPDDLDPFFVVYDWESGASLDALEERAQGVPLDLALPVEVGGALQFVGYDLRTSEVTPGGVVELLTLWRVIDPEPVRPHDLSNAELDLVFFTHALDATGAVVGQEDRLDAPAWDWQAGDAVAQIHRVALPQDLPAGPLLLEIGVYRRADMLRLSVSAGGEVAGDRILLPPVEVVSP